MTRHTVALVLAAAVALASARASWSRARHWWSHPTSGTTRVDGAVAELGAMVPAGVRELGFRPVPARDDARRVLAQYALVPRLVVDGSPRAEFVLADLPDDDAEALARAEGLVEVARREGFHLLRRRPR